MNAPAVAPESLLLGTPLFDPAKRWPAPDPAVWAFHRRMPAYLATTLFDCRYAGQSHELPVPHPSKFHTEHYRRNGYARRGHHLDGVAVRARAALPSPVSPADLPAPERAGAVGPAVIAEADCTIWVPEGWTAEPGVAGALVLRRSPR